MANMGNIEFVDIAANERDLTGGYYAEILLRLRHRLADDCIRARTGRTRSILPEYDSSNTNIRWFQINLHLNPTTRVSLMLRRDNLYVWGYRVNAGRWREFGVEGRSTRRIHGSQFLGFTEDYGDLTRRASQGSLGRELGRDALLTAARGLASATDDPTVAGSLLVMINMFSEAARFLPIQQFVLDRFENGSAVPAWIADLEHRWGQLCGYVLYYYYHPDQQFVPQSLTIERDGRSQTVVVRTIDDMLEYLAVLQKNPRKIQPAPRS